jgi:hypothetical protein
MKNAQWIKPLWPGDIPANTSPLWNTQEEKWEFISVIEPIETANTANTI